MGLNKEQHFVEKLMVMEMSKTCSCGQTKMKSRTYLNIALKYIFKNRADLKNMLKKNSSVCGLGTWRASSYNSESMFKTSVSQAAVQF